MEIKQAFATSLKRVRKAQGLTQEDFSDISSRTYMSTLERALKSPTLEKIDALAKTLQIHPLTLLLITYANMDAEKDWSEILKIVQNQIHELQIKI